MSEFQTDELPSRRDFIRIGSVPLVLGSLFGASSAISHAQENFKARHKVVLLWLSGGPSQLETFDPAYSAPEQAAGPHGSIGNGEDRLSGLLPRLANIRRRYALLRAIDTGNNDHEIATRRVLRPGIERPAVPTMALRLSRGSSLIPYVFIETPYSQPRAPHQHTRSALHLDDNMWNRTRGYFNPPENIQPRPDLRLSQRRHLSNVVNTLALPQDLDQQFTETRQQAFDLLQESGTVRAAFHPTSEQIDQMRSEFGPYPLGAAMHLAMRLTESGVQFVTVQHSGYDLHEGINNRYQGMVPKCLHLDTALSGAIQYMTRRGIEDTLVVCLGEFGRTPLITDRYPDGRPKLGEGREHYRWGTSALLAGGNVIPGSSYGRTNPRNGGPVTSITLEELLNTIYKGAGHTTQNDAPYVDPVVRSS